MSQPSLKTAWMWANTDGETNGLSIDMETRLLHWFDSIGCACGDSTAVQTPEQYRARGCPIGELPEDVQAELDATVDFLVAEE